MGILENMEKMVREENGIIVWDVDGVLAPYEFGNDRHRMEDWSKQFTEKGEGPYGNIKPVEKLKEYIQRVGCENCWVCAVAVPYEAMAKARFAERAYGIPDNQIFFVSCGEEKLQMLDTIQSVAGSRPVAVVDDSVPVLDHIAEKRNDVMTVHISSFLSM